VVTVPNNQLDMAGTTSRFS